jgi:hypothetical protein
MKIKDILTTNGRRISPNIRRPSWISNDSCTYDSFNGDCYFKIGEGDDADCFVGRLSYEDFIADDWEIVE